MKQCPNCRNQIQDDAAFCPVCGTAVNAYHSFPEPYPPQSAYTPPPAYIPPMPKIDPYDHSTKFTAADVSTHKLLAMLVYLFDFIGIIIALLAAKESEYTAFHVRQGMKYCVVEALLALCAAIFCWTFLVPILAVIAMAVVLVLKFISFVQVCKGKSAEPAIIRSLKFLN